RGRSSAGNGRRFLETQPATSPAGSGWLHPREVPAWPSSGAGGPPPHAASRRSSSRPRLTTSRQPAVSASSAPRSSHLIKTQRPGLYPEVADAVLLAATPHTLGHRHAAREKDPDPFLDGDIGEGPP